MIKLLDKNGNKLKDRDFIEFQWNRSWSEFGTFSLYMRASDYSSEIMYVQNIGRPETGIVQKVVYEQKTSGDFVTLSGMFLEGLLNWGSCAVGMSYDFTASDSKNMMKAFIADNLYCQEPELPPSGWGYTGPPVIYSNRQLYRAHIDDSAVIPTTSNNLFVDAGSAFGDTFLEWLNSLDLSCYCKPYFSKGDESKVPLLGLDIVTYKGVDKKNLVYFGKAWKNVTTMTYSLDTSAERADYLTVQQIDDDNVSSFTNVHKISTDDGVKNFIFEEYVDGNNRPSGLGMAYPARVKSTSITSTTDDTTVRNEMDTQAKLDMVGSYYKVESISCDVIQNRFKYLEDYDIGDTCSIVIDELGIMYSARIESIYEVWKSNTVEIQVVLGTPYKQKYRKVVVI